MRSGRVGLIVFLGVCLILLVLNLTVGKRSHKLDRSTLSIQSTFAELLGKETSAWRHFNPVDDGIALERYTKLYEKNKHLQFDGTPSFKTPRVIHVIWLGPNHFPVESIENLRTWVAYHPGWTIKFWTDRERLCPVNAMEICYIDDFTFKKLKPNFDEAETWAEKSELLRFEILYQEGGLYIDHYVSCLKSFHQLHTGYDFFTSLEVPHEPIDDRSLTSGISIIGAREKHPVIKASIDYIEKNWSKNREVSAKDPLDEVMGIVHRSYMALTHALLENLDKPGNRDVVFPASYFYSNGTLPSFYSYKCLGQGHSRTHAATPMEKVVSTYIGKARLKTKRLCLLQCGSALLLVTSFILCFRRRPAR